MPPVKHIGESGLGDPGEPDLTASQPVLEDQVNDFILANSLIEPGDKVLVAVSAGLDSMVLFEVLRRLTLRLNFTLAAAYFDHGLRGSQTEQEAALVRARCESHGIPFVAGRAQPGLAGRNAGRGLQAAARMERYAFLWESATRLGCRRLATGHHRDDQAETVLMRLLKGSGPAGLAGIRPSSLSGRLIRPLLAVPRSRLERFARDNAIAWAEDPTNLTDKYYRNRLRHQLIPRIERTYDPLFSENLALLAEEAAGLRSQLDREIAPLLERGVLLRGRSRLTLDCGALSALPSLVRRHLIVSGVFQLTGGKLILSGRPLSTVERLINGPSSRQADLPGGLCAWKEFDKLEISAKPAGQKSSPRADQPLACPGNTCFELGGVSWTISGEEVAQPPLELRPQDTSPDQERFRELFDLDRLSLPLSIGSRRSGERIRPFGMGGGSKKLKKVFLEKRVPKSRRDEIPVIRDAGGRVLWVCGVVRSELAPLTPRSVKVLALSVHPCRVEGREVIGGNDH